MVNLEVVRRESEAFVKARPLVAVFTAVTGIGDISARHLAALHADNGPGLRVYILGRKEEAANKCLAECRAVCPQGQFHFIEVEDLSLLRDVDRVSAEIDRLVREHSTAESPPRIDLLVMTQGQVEFGPRIGTHTDGRCFGRRISKLTTRLARYQRRSRQVHVSAILFTYPAHKQAHALAIGVIGACTHHLGLRCGHGGQTLQGRPLPP